MYTKNKRGAIMKLEEIQTKPFELFDKEWALVTAGNKDKYNTMTISWGTMGTIWNKPVVIVYIKPVRHTHSFLMSNDYFTVSFYDNKYRDALKILGSKSGKDVDKVALTDLHPVFLDKGVTFKEAKQTYVLKKIYAARLDKDAVPEFAHKEFYLEEEEHYMFIGEVEEIL